VCILSVGNLVLVKVVLQSRKVLLFNVLTSRRMLGDAVCLLSVATKGAKIRQNLQTFRCLK